MSSKVDEMSSKMDEILFQRDEENPEKREEMVRLREGIKLKISQLKENFHLLSDEQEEGYFHLKHQFVLKQSKIDNEFNFNLDQLRGFDATCNEIISTLPTTSSSS